MGMVIQGQWRHDDETVFDGAFIRPESVFDAVPAANIAAQLQADPARYLVIGSNTCPWAHRVMLVRSLKGLIGQVPLHIAFGPRRQGYALNGGRPWPIPGTDSHILHLHELYTLSERDYTGRSTVPVLWDSATRQIVSNESATLMRALDAIPHPDPDADFTLVPAPLQSNIDNLNAEIYHKLSNGVYRAAFAEKQLAYDAAVNDVFNTLDSLESRLMNRRLLFGSILTESDLRLFTTLFRFDSVYYLQHFTSLRRLTDYPNLWAYARDLYSWRGIGSVLSHDAMHAAEYANAAHGIVPVAPQADWKASHDREKFGPAAVALRTGAKRDVEPGKFPPVRE